MSHEVPVHEAQHQLFKLIQEALAGEEVIITQDDQPVVCLKPVEKRTKRQLGTAKGLVVLKEGFKDIPDDYKNYLP
ncbi:MAG: type II toxin-antitoxin system prevent-host-death family antitoxin [Proteobacteria bacterium]|nr:type II toxin-antitoxin system prevent-host-death family antitoxin [Pseudomonadota bacterium]